MFDSGLPKEEIEGPVPVAWRAVFAQIVERWVARDYGLKLRPAGVSAIAPDLAEYVASQITSYGDELVSLSDETWRRSIYIWDGHFWRVIIDLCTVEQGLSDLALFAKVSERGDDLLFEVESVYVP